MRRELPYDSHDDDPSARIIMSWRIFSLDDDYEVTQFDGLSESHGAN